MSTLELTSERVDKICAKKRVTRSDIVRAFAQKMAPPTTSLDEAIDHVAKWLRVPKPTARGLYDILCE